MMSHWEKLKRISKKTYAMVDVYLLDKASDKIKKIMGFEKFDDTKILIKTDDKLQMILL